MWLLLSIGLVVAIIVLMLATGVIRIEVSTKHGSDPVQQEPKDRPNVFLTTVLFWLLIGPIVHVVIAVLQPGIIGLILLLLVVPAIFALIGLWFVGVLVLDWICSRRSNAIIKRANSGDTSGALQEAQEWLIERPNNARAWLTLAVLHIHAEDWHAAEKAALCYEQLRPAAIELVTLKPFIVSKLGRIDEAAALFEVAIKNYPDQFNLYIDHCVFLLDNNRCNEAIQQLEVAEQKRRQVGLLGKFSRELFAAQIAGCRARIAAHQQGAKDDDKVVET